LSKIIGGTWGSIENWLEPKIKPSLAGLPFGLFKGQICQIWPFLKLFARNKMVWPFGLF